MEQIIYKQGYRVSWQEANFREALQAASDYRGDVTLELANGQNLEGYIFNFRDNEIYLFPKDAPHKVSLGINEIRSLYFSGKDAAAGNSWEEYQARKKKSRKKYINLFLGSLI